MTHIIDNQIVESMAQFRGITTDLEIIPTTASIYQMTVSGEHHVHCFTGSTPGQIVQLPNSTSIIVGLQYWIFNNSTVSVTVRLADGSQSFVLLVGASVRYILRANGTVAGVWNRAVTSGSPFSGTAAIICGYGGNAGTGRFLEFVAGNSSDVSPFVAITTYTLVGLSIAGTGPHTSVISLFKNGNFVTPIAALTTTNSNNVYTNTLSVPLLEGDLVTVQVTSGAISKPFCAVYILGN